MPPVGRISEWQRERGFGYLDSDGRRVFLHFREFKARHKEPEVGDVVGFVMGADPRGRPCAQQAVQLDSGGRPTNPDGNYRGPIRVVHFLIMSLLVLPGYAVYRSLGAAGLYCAGGWIAFMSAVTYLVYARDKRQAREKGPREPEFWLHLGELFGGWPGAFFAQRRLRHKSAKYSYQFVFILILGLHQFLAIDALRGWPFVRLVIHALKKF